MSLLSLFAFAIYAAEAIISPLPDDGRVFPTPIPTPAVSFGQLAIAVVPQVLGAEAEATPSPTPSPTASAGEATPLSAVVPPGGTKAETPRPTRKNAFTIAVLGDSMVDTLGPGVPHLKNRLSALYPNTLFTILNYGVGGTNIDYGLERLTHDYDYLGHHVPSLVSQRPDIVVVESFGYNPYTFDEGALTTHWLRLTTVVDTIKDKLPESKIVIAATIAPNEGVFGDGALNWDSDAKSKKVRIIKNYLENAVGFAKGEHLPLADVYHATLDNTENGKLAYINPVDHIHYSDAGRSLFAQKVAEAIVANRLLE